jgi:RNA polymerase sigma-70 factor (ECF subfamily)
MENEESHIVALLHGRKREAISLLYDRFAPTLYGIVLRIVHSKELAEDVVQEAFIKAWRHGHTYDPQKGTLFTWLLNIARNAAIDKTRTAAFKRNLRQQPIDNGMCNDTLHSVEQRPDHIGLDKMVNELEEKHRVIIDLIYFQGFTHTEVPDHLKIPLGTVKTRLRIALRELRKYFGEQKVKFWIITICYWFLNI